MERKKQNMLTMQKAKIKKNKFKKKKDKKRGDAHSRVGVVVEKQIHTHKKQNILRWMADEMTIHIWHM